MVSAKMKAILRSVICRWRTTKITIGVFGVIMVAYLAVMFLAAYASLKTRLVPNMIFSPPLLQTISSSQCEMNLSVSQYFAKYVNINVNLKNTRIYRHHVAKLSVELVNNGKKHLPSIGWSVYFNSISMLDEFSMRDTLAFMSETDVTQLLNTNITFHHIDGGLYKITPDNKFNGIAPNQSIVINLRVQNLIFRHFMTPRWYVVGSDNTPHVIQSTDDDELNFVKVTFKEYDFLSKRLKNSLERTLSAEDRYESYSSQDLKKAPMRILPTPHRSNLSESETVEIYPPQWLVCGDSKEFNNEVEILKGFFNFRTSTLHACPSSQYRSIRFVQRRVSQQSDEAYQLFIANKVPSITIVAEKSSGAFYAVQSLISLAEQTGLHEKYQIPTGVILDWPRFPYRGILLDVSRNFMKAKAVIKIIKTMSLYKLNKLHFHLTDDEGWRVEIDGLPELTKFGAFRRHSLHDIDTVLPSLGSGPHGNTSGSGFYSKQEYLEILRVAVAHHVEVIPEIDVPGHSRATIKAMNARFDQLAKQGYAEKAKEFLISDINETSSFTFFKYFAHNTINPCLNSTYRFLDHVVGALKDLHQSVQPLQTIHIGEDEVSTEPWMESPACSALLNNSAKFPFSHHDLHEHFFRTLGQICTQKHGLNIGVWADGIFRTDTQERYPYSKPSGKSDVIAYDWISTEKSRQMLLKDGYKLVLAQSSYLYFDHPAEPDADELGLRWAGSVNDRKVFSYEPNSAFPTSLKSNLSSDLEKNIYGIQGQIWSELLRNEKMVHHQLFPRLIALAERAWHKAEWENVESPTEKIKLQDEDWNEFANVIGYKELPRLKRRDIAYRIPPPGAVIKNGRLYISSLYPGFTFKCRTLTNESDWSTCQRDQPITFDQKYQLYSTDNNRKSKVVELGNKAKVQNPLDAINLLKRLL